MGVFRGGYRSFWVLWWVFLKFGFSLVHSFIAVVVVVVHTLGCRSGGKHGEFCCLTLIFLRLNTLYQNL